MAKMTNKQKYEAMRAWLCEKKIKFTENHVTRHLKIDLWIPHLMIAVHIGEDDGTFYRKTHKWCKPFFIRDSETKAFILEKIENCVYDQMVYMQRKMERECNDNIAGAQTDKD